MRGERALPVGLRPADGGCRHASPPSCWDSEGGGDGARGARGLHDAHHGEDDCAGRSAAEERRLELPSHHGAACAELGTVDDGHLAGICGGGCSRTRGGGDVVPGPDLSCAALAADLSAQLQRGPSAQLFSLQTWRWRHGIRDCMQRPGGVEEQHGRTRAHRGVPRARGTSARPTLPCPPEGPGRRPELATCRRRRVCPRLTAAAVYIMCWAATTSITSGSHDPGQSILGQGTCRETGPSHFEVTCTASGIFLDSAGKSAYKRCAPILCPPFQAPEFSVAVPLRGAVPGEMKLGDELEVKCNAGYVYREPADYSGGAQLTNRTQCTRSPVCEFTPTLICVYNTVCSGYLHQSFVCTHVHMKPC